MDATVTYDPLVVAAFDVMGVKRLARTTTGSDVAADVIANLWANLLCGRDAYESADFRGASFPLYRASDHFSDSAYVYGDPAVSIQLQADWLALRAAASLAVAVCHPKQKYALRCGIGVGNLVERALPAGLSGRVRIGTAMAQAYTAEASQDWLGGAITDELAACRLLPTLNVVPYAVPVKQGCRPLRYAVNWVAAARNCGDWAPRSVEHLKQSVVTAFETAGSPREASAEAKLANTLRFVDEVFDASAPHS